MAVVLFAVSASRFLPICESLRHDDRTNIIDDQNIVSGPGSFAQSHVDLIADNSEGTCLTCDTLGRAELKATVASSNTSDDLKKLHITLSKFPATEIQLIEDSLPNNFMVPDEFVIGHQSSLAMACIQSLVILV